MNSAHLHLLLTHAPIFGTLAGLFLLLFGAARKSEQVKRLGLLFFIMTAAVTLPTYLTGAPSAQQLKSAFPTMPLEIAEQHEEVAILALVAVLFLGVLALAGSFLFQKAKNIPGWFTATVVALAIVSMVSLAWTATLGGKVRHTEIRNEAPPPPQEGH